MALSRHPAIATMAMLLMPDDNPNANTSNGITPIAPKIKPTHPANVSTLPTTTNRTTLPRKSRKVYTIKDHPLAPLRHNVTQQ